MGRRWAVSATLTRTGGAPVEGEPVSFTIGGSTQTALTATVQLRRSSTGRRSTR